MGASNGGLGGVYGGGGIQPQPPSGGGTRGFDVMPRQTPIALGNFGPKSGPGNNPGDGGMTTTDPNNPFWAGPRTLPPPPKPQPMPPAGPSGGLGGGVWAPTPIARPNPIGGQIPGYTPPPGVGPIKYPGDSPGAPQPMPPTTSPGVNPVDSPGAPQPMPPTTSPGVNPVDSPGIPQPMPPTTGPGVGPIKYPGDPTPPGTGGSSGGNVTGPRPSLFPMPQPKMPWRTNVNFYRPPQTKFR